MARDLGPLLWRERVRRPWTRLLGTAVVVLPLVYVVTRNWLLVVVSLGGCATVLGLAQRIRLDVHEEGVLVGGFIRTRRYRWSDITAFSPMPLSTGRAGFTGAVVVSGVNHEIHALGEPGLYEKLRELNGLLEQHRTGTEITYVPPTTDSRRSDFSRRRLTLWLGPGAGWWPGGRQGPPTEGH